MLDSKSGPVQDESMDISMATPTPAGRPAATPMAASNSFSQPVPLAPQVTRGAQVHLVAVSPQSQPIQISQFTQNSHLVQIVGATEGSVGYHSPIAYTQQVLHLYHISKL